MTTTHDLGTAQASCPHCSGKARQGVSLDPSRRRFLRLLAFGGAAAAIAPTLGSKATAAVQEHYERPAAGPRTSRRLVVLEFSGGNDGLSTLVPHGDPRYYDLRQSTAIPVDEVLDLDGQVGLHPNLVRLHARGVAVVQGVGSARPDLSHFAMLDRWWRGDVDGAAGSQGTGFLGRLCDELRGDEVVTGVSLGWGPTPALLSARATTMALPDPDVGEVFTGADGDAFYARIRQALRTMSRVPEGEDTDHEWLPMARRGIATALDFAALLDGLPEPSPRYDPDTDDNLMVQMALAARLLATEGGPRIVHVPVDADFDTHDDHDGRFHGYMERIDAALDTLLTDLDDRGIAGGTLVATTSEFGRRAADNGSSGLDHGAASVALLAGPVNPGLHGEHPSLSQLDAEDNLVATVGFDRYYATLAESWFGIPSSEVLPGAPPPLDGVV